MKVLFDIEENELNVRFDAETIEELSKLMEAANLTKSPVKTFGSVGAKLAYCWFKIPLQKKKSHYIAREFGNQKG